MIVSRLKAAFSTVRISMYIYVQVKGFPRQSEYNEHMWKSTSKYALDLVSLQTIVDRRILQTMIDYCTVLVERLCRRMLVLQYAWLILDTTLGFVAFFNIFGTGIATEIEILETNIFAWLSKKWLLSE